ncbi:MAG: prolyl oligopeptidase family serine peptidase [Gemmatimonadales bacterium]
MNRFLRSSTLLALGLPAALAAQARRPMTALDIQLLRQTGNVALSPNGQWALYTLSVPDWQAARRYTDIWIVSTGSGAGSERQLTFTRDKSETSPTWSTDGSFFVFSSDRDGTGGNPPDQLFMMRPDGGEARRITDAKDGVGRFAFTKDGRWLVYSAGKSGEQQVWALAVSDLGTDSLKPVEITKHKTPVTWWDLTDDSRQLYFVSPDTVDKDNKDRVEKRFNVRVRNEDLPLDHLWVTDLASKQEKRLTGGTDYSVGGVTISGDGKWVGFEGAPNDRYKRTITEAGNYSDLYLVNTTTGGIERLTTNAEIGESPLSFSPDGRWVAFAASNDFTYQRDTRVYLRETAAAGTPFRKLADGYDGGSTVGWWSKDGKTIYFNDGVRVTNQVLALDVASGVVRQITQEPAALFARRDETTGMILMNYSDGMTPPSDYLVRSEADLPNRSNWVRLTNANPQVANFALGESEEFTWKSKDGKSVSGVLLKPAGYQPGRRYPLIVQIHGGPAGADVLRFNGGYGSQIYAGAGYVVLMPNYRGSTNYGERHRMETAGVGKYFDRGYEDIMTGVDALIAQGIVHPDSMGAMGWSAGGHYSNWILTHTTRFKAISSGAGTMNWISMYAQSDVQRNRQWYMGGDLPYDNYDAYWKVSPLKYIRNAKTPTLIHVVDGDPRVPRPQSEELHMALKRIGVPTEFFVYPGATHGIPDPRNQLTKAVVEFDWFEKWIRGKPGWFTWSEMLKTLGEPAPAMKR